MNESPLPLVSIIIPAYNNWPLVCQAVDCALGQTYGNLEVIVVDDGSTDDTARFLKERYGNKIVCVRQANKGPGGARNTGMRHASGRYLQFLDADDLLAPDKVSLQVDLLRQLPGRALSYCDYVCCDLDDITVTYDARHLSPKLQAENPLTDIILKWETELSIPIHCFLFDAAIFREDGIAFDETLPTNEDWDCWMEVFASRPGVVYLDRVLAYYRVRHESRCSDRLKMRNGHLKAINKQLARHGENRELVRHLTARKARMKLLYRDASLMMRLVDHCPPALKEAYGRVVPWRIRHFFATPEKDLRSRFRGLVCPD